MPGCKFNLTKMNQYDISLEDNVPEDSRITQDVIDNLNKPSFDTISNVEVIDYIYKFCKKMLEYSKNRYDSREMACAINLDTLELIGATFGTVRSIDIGSLVIQMNKESASYIVMHNHPSDLGFSARDLNTFVMTTNIAILMILGNKGSIYTLEKTQSINIDERIKIKKLIIAYKNGNKNFSDIIPELYKYGISYNCFIKE
jgi:hypothetical protein